MPDTVVGAGITMEKKTEKISTTTELIWRKGNRK